jgi:hypothetical protein
MGLQPPKKKGFEVKDLTVGTGEEATKDSVVAVDVREFLRRGDEVSPSPLFGTRRVIDLGQRHCIAGLRYGIPGMRVGGTREITISPHLAYGKDGIPGTIPANALLRCCVELVEIRPHRAMLPQDWLAGKVLMVSRGRGAKSRQPEWRFSVHESGTTLLRFQPAPDDQPRETHWRQISIPFALDKVDEFIQEAIELPKQMPNECVDWNSGFIDMQDGGRVIKDKRSGAQCMVIEVRESGKTVLMIGVHEEGLTFRRSAFLRTVEDLTMPYLSADPAST